MGRREGRCRRGGGVARRAGWRGGMEWQGRRSGRRSGRGYRSGEMWRGEV